MPRFRLRCGVCSGRRNRLVNGRGGALWPCSGARARVRVSGCVREAMRSVDAGREPPVVGYVLYFPKVARNSHVNLSTFEIGSLELQCLWGVLKSSGARITCDFWLISRRVALLSHGCRHGLAGLGHVGKGAVWLSLDILTKSRLAPHPGGCPTPTQRITQPEGRKTITPFHGTLPAGVALAASLWRGQKNAQPLHLGVLVCQRPLDVRARHAQAFSNKCSARHKLTVCHAVMHRLVTTLSTVLTGVWGLRARVLW